MAGPLTGREIHLTSRPHGEPTLENFALVERAIPEAGAGQVLVRNRFISVDPYMRGRMNDAKSYVPPFAVGAPMDGGAVGEVMASQSPDLAPGDTVLHQLGWREFAVADARAFRKVDPSAAPSSAYLGVLGIPGLTAYVGIVDIAAMRAGDVVFVSAAAGAVGSLAGQFAKLLGASKVIGSAGSDEKVGYVISQLGFDTAFNYRSGPVHKQLRSAAPDGIDVYFDNVGGDHLEAAIGSMRTFGRAALCGAIGDYNATEPVPGPRNLPLLAVPRRLTLRGYIILDHFDRMHAFLAQASVWLRQGKIRTRETVIDGIENAPAAFLGLLHGDNVGKMLVRLN